MDTELGSDGLELSFPRVKYRIGLSMGNIASPYFLKYDRPSPLREKFVLAKYTTMTCATNEYL